MANLSFGPDGFTRNGHTLTFDDNGELATSQIGAIHRLWPWWTAQTSSDVINITASGGIMDWQDYGAGVAFTGSYSAIFHDGFFQKHATASDIAGRFSQARTWVYGAPNTNSHNQIDVDLDVVKYHYSTGWQTTGLAEITNTLDPARGPRWFVTESKWDTHDGSNAADVTRYGLRNNRTDYDFKVGAVWLEIIR